MALKQKPTSETEYSAYVSRKPICG